MINYKNLPFRRKVGFTVAAIQVLISAMSLIEFQINQGKSDMGTIGYWIIMLLGLPLFIFYERIHNVINTIVYHSKHAPNYSEFIPLIIFILMNAILYYVIGCLFGVMGEKIRNRHGRKIN